MIELEGVPELIDPVMVAAFEGWNDAGDAASTAVAHLDREWKGEVFAALKDSGTAIEVNTAARRKGLDSFFPSMEMINGAKREGVDVLFLGSDAHAPEQVGYDFEVAAHLVPHAIGGCDD